MTKKEMQELQRRIERLMAMQGIYPDKVSQYYADNIQPTFDKALIKMDYAFFDKIAKFIKKKKEEELKGQIQKILKNENND